MASSNWESELPGLRQRLLEQDRVGEVLNFLERRLPLDPRVEPAAAVLLAHARRLNGDHRRALALYQALEPLDGEGLEIPLGAASCAMLLGHEEDARTRLAAVRARAEAVLDRVRIALLEARFNLYRGEWLQATTLADEAWESAVVSGARREELLAESIRYLVLALRGREEEALTGFRRVGDELVARGHLWWGTITLLNLSEQLSTLRAFGEADRLLRHCEPLTEQVQSGYITNSLRQARAWRAIQAGQYDVAERYARQVLSQLDCSPFFHLAMLTGQQLAGALFRQGRGRQAVRVVQDLKQQAEVAGNALHTGLAVQAEGIYLLRLGLPEEALACLDRALELLGGERDPRRWLIACLHAAAAHMQLGDHDRAPDLLRRALEASEGRAFLTSFIEARDILIPLLLQYGDELPETLGVVGEVIVHLGHPGLVKRLLRRGPGGKRLFLRSIDQQDIRPHRHTLQRLSKDSSREIRTLTRQLLERWRGGARYRVVLLGPVRVFSGRRMLADSEWRRPQVRRLFLFFLTHAGRWIPSEQLLEQLWPEPDPVRTRRILATLISYLRGAIEPWRLSGEPSVFIRNERGRYGFFPDDRFRTDAEEFAEAVRSGQTLCASGSWEAAVQTLQPALDLYVGDYCVEFPYEDWLRETRDALRELYFTGLRAGAEALGRLQRTAEAVVLLERGLQRDPFRVELLVDLVPLLGAMDRAPQACQWCRKVLELDDGLLSAEERGRLHRLLEQLEGRRAALPDRGAG